MINADSFKQTDFKYSERSSEQAAYRVTSAEMNRYSEQQRELAKRIATEKILYAEQLGISSTEMNGRIEELCLISESTIKKTCQGKIPPTRRFLYKFTVGLGMTLEKANELFSLCGGPLSADCAADYVCICAIRDGDSVMSMIEEMDTFCGISLYMKDRNDSK